MSAIMKMSDWIGPAQTALTEAQVMSEAIHALAGRLIEDCRGDDFPLLEAIKACCLRMDIAVADLIEEAQSLQLAGGEQ